MASSDPRNIVSLTLFRHKASAYEHPDCGEWRGKFFARYLPVIIRAYKAFYPDWRIVIHHDSSVYTNLYGDVLIGLEKDGIVELEEVAQDPPSLAEASLWRMRPIRMSSLAKVVITRDIDSLPTAREAEMVREFIASEAIAQVIHDSPSHNGLMTGMMAFKVREVCARVDTHDLFFWLRDRGRSDYLDFDVHETDQVILNRHLRPSIADGLLETKGTAIERNTPLERLGRHIGAPFDHREAAVVLSQTGLSSDVSIEWQRIESREKSIGYSINASPAFADNRRRVIIGVDHNLVYAFFTPIVTAMWKAMGFGVEIVALDPIRGSVNEVRMRTYRHALRAARMEGARIHFVSEVVFGNMFLNSTIAQTARLIGGSLRDVSDDAWILTGDVDMLPLAKMPEFLGAPAREGRPTLYFANAYAHEPVPHWPLCYIGMTKRLWRSTVGDDGSPEKTLQRILFANLGGRCDWSSSEMWHAWNFDERWLSNKIANRGDVNDFMRVNRDTSKDRVDRAWWDKCPPANQCVDCHALRPGYSEENWPKIRLVIIESGVLRMEEVIRIDEYVRSFRHMAGEGGA